jgi:hypothetical protein
MKREKPLKTCGALTIIKSIIQCCILLIMLKNTLTMHGPMNVKKKWTAVIGLRIKSSGRLSWTFL